MEPLDQHESDSQYTQLRPSSLAEFTGQANAKEQLRTQIEAARKRGESLRHILLGGPPGLGKTSLASIVAEETGRDFHIASGPHIASATDLMWMPFALEEGDIVFIDEIHAVKRSMAEILHGIMEDYIIEYKRKESGIAHQEREQLPPFTIMGATTEVGSLSKPLRDRFEVQIDLGFYNEDELAAIVERTAQLLGNQLDSEAAADLAQRARGVPRIANRLTKLASDHALAEHNSREITSEVVAAAMHRIGVDSMGLDQLDRQIIATLVEQFESGPAGLQTLAGAIAESADTVESHEPYLTQIRFLERTAKGRLATDRARRYVKSQRRAEANAERAEPATIGSLFG